MRFLSILISAASVAVAVAQSTSNIAFTTVPASVQVGQSYNISWAGGDNTVRNCRWSNPLFMLIYYSGCHYNAAEGRSRRPPDCPNPDKYDPPHPVEAISLTQSQLMQLAPHSLGLQPHRSSMETTMLCKSPKVSIASIIRANSPYQVVLTQYLHPSLHS